MSFFSPHTGIASRQPESRWHIYRGRCHAKRKKQGGHSTGAPPLPIPNREVKPRRADGTAKAGEQVTAALEAGRTDESLPGRHSFCPLPCPFLFLPRASPFPFPLSPLHLPSPASASLPPRSALKRLNKAIKGRTGRPDLRPGRAIQRMKGRAD